MKSKTKVVLKVGRPGLTTEAKTLMFKEPKVIALTGKVIKEELAELAMEEIEKARVK